MKILHVPFSFYPDPPGGTEIYVEALAAQSQLLGAEVVIAAPSERMASYTFENLEVRRFAISNQAADLRDLYGEGDKVAAQNFGFILDVEKPDLVHLHAFTQAASLRLVEQVKRRRLPTVFTYHTPTVSCQRGTLMQWGHTVCDGQLDVWTCTRCTLHGFGLDKMTSTVLAMLPASVGWLVGGAGLSGKVWTALRMRELMQVRHGAVRSLMTEVNHVVALCQWARELLLRNGVPAEKITVSPHGLPQTHPKNIVGRGCLDATHVPLRVAFLGRLDPTKGSDTLIRAIQMLPELPVVLHLYGIVQGSAGEAYMRQLKALAAGDPRICFLPAVSSDQIPSMLRDYHLLAVPSRWLETGPLVVLEAFAAGIPVLGSNLGGIPEWVTHEVNGLLLEPDSPGVWSQALQRLSEDRNLLRRLQEGVRSPRGMDVVAGEMLELYHCLLQN